MKQNLKKLIVIGAIFGLGMLVMYKISTPASANIGPAGPVIVVSKTYSGTVHSINKRGPVWEGSVKKPDDQLFPANFFPSGVNLHVDEHIQYVNLLTTLPDGVIQMETVVVFPQINNP